MIILFGDIETLQVTYRKYIWSRERFVLIIPQDIWSRINLSIREQVIITVIVEINKRYTSQVIK